MTKVLLVDDSPVVRRVLAHRLQGEGFDVREESSAAAARALDTSGVACVVIDIELSDGSGIELGAELLARHPKLPVAFYTASGDSGAVESARTYGPVFVKPDLEALASWVKGQPPPTK
jgi:DNA-binding NtrC family response regulator